MVRIKLEKLGEEGAVDVSKNVFNELCELRRINEDIRGLMQNMELSMKKIAGGFDKMITTVDDGISKANEWMDAAAEARETLKAVKDAIGEVTSALDKNSEAHGDAGGTT